MEEAEKAWRAHVAGAWDGPIRTARDTFMGGWMAAREHDNFDSMRSRIAALEAVIKRVRELWAGWLIDSDAIDETLALAPSVVLDGMIREAKTEGRKEAVTALAEGELTDLIANTYASEFYDPAGHAARAIRALLGGA